MIKFPNLQNAQKSSPNPYVLKDTIKAQESLLDFVLIKKPPPNRQVLPNSLLQMQEDLRKYRNSYVKRLLDQKAKQKKPKNPKKSLTEFEKYGLDLYKRQREYLEVDNLHQIFKDTDVRYLTDEMSS